MEINEAKTLLDWEEAPEEQRASMAAQAAEEAAEWARGLAESDPARAEDLMASLSKGMAPKLEAHQALALLIAAAIMGDRQGRQTAAEMLKSSRLSWSGGEAELGEPGYSDLARAALQTGGAKDKIKLMVEAAAGQRAKAKAEAEAKAQADAKGLAKRVQQAVEAEREKIRQARIAKRKQSGMTASAATKTYQGTLGHTVVAVKSCRTNRLVRPSSLAALMREGKVEESDIAGVGESRVGKKYYREEVPAALNPHTGELVPLADLSDYLSADDVLAGEMKKQAQAESAEWPAASWTIEMRVPTGGERWFIYDGWSKFDDVTAVVKVGGPGSMQPEPMAGAKTRQQNFTGVWWPDAMMAAEFLERALKMQGALKYRRDLAESKFKLHQLDGGLFSCDPQTGNRISTPWGDAWAGHPAKMTAGMTNPGKSNP